MKKAKLAQRIELLTIALSDFVNQSYLISEVQRLTDKLIQQAELLKVKDQTIESLRLEIEVEKKREQ